MSPESLRIQNAERKGTIGSKKITKCQSAQVARETRKLAMAKRAKDQVADCQVQVQLKLKFGTQAQVQARLRSCCHILLR